MTFEEIYSKRKERIFLSKRETIEMAKVMIERLKFVCSTNMPVNLDNKLYNLIDISSETDLKNGKFVIKLSEEMTPLELEDALIHEWAHVRYWKTGISHSYDHDAHFGIEFAFVYCEYHGLR